VSPSDLQEVALDFPADGAYLQKQVLPEISAIPLPLFYGQGILIRDNLANFFAYLVQYGHASITHACVTTPFGGSI
jgi:hypothetical protein